MLDKMLAKRTEIMARAEVVRSVAGSGYHDNDSTGPLKHPDPVGRRDAKIETHVVVFKQPFETYLVPPDADRVLEAMHAFYEANESILLQSRLDQAQRTLIETAKEYAGRLLQDGCFVIRNQQFNDVLAILHFLDIGVTTTAV